MYTPKSFLNAHPMRAFRNNNPGNLIKTGDNWIGKIANGTDAKFEQFVNIRYGLRALYKNLITGFKKNVNTVSKIITKYAPASDGNNTTAYIGTVAKRLGVNANDVLTPNRETLIALAKAIVSVEVKAEYVGDLSDADYNDGYEAITHTKVENATFSITKYLNIIIPVALFFYTIYTIGV
jgi:hypothetical protein